MRFNRSFPTAGMPLRALLEVLPVVARGPLSLVPQRAHSMMLCVALNHVLAPELRAAELDFLAQRSLAIHIPELNTRFCITLTGTRLVPANPRCADLTLRGGLREFLELALREEDPDSLFFQRRLHLDGDVELGLALKNFLDAIEIDQARLPAMLRPLAMRARAAALRALGYGARSAIPGEPYQ
jgi:predicted lipid carrier protein YhbT